MPEIPQNIEKEIAELEQILAEKRASLEEKRAAGEIAALPHPKEILREAVKEKIAVHPAPSHPPPAVFPAPAAQTQPSVSAPPLSYFSDELKKSVQELVNISFQKSLGEAISIAKSSQNPALLDAFHDIIVDELYEYLIKKGKLETVN